MLTTDILQKTAGLEGLTAEQLQTIATLSANDEQSVISAKYREMHDTIDAKIKEATGIEKGSDKTTDYLARVLNHTKNAVLQTAKLEQQVKELQEKQSSTPDNDDRVAKLQADNADLVKRLNSKSEELKTQRAEFEREKDNYILTAELNKAMSSIALNTELPETTLRLLRDNAIDKVRSSNPEFIDDGNGGKVLSFRDSQGVTLRNPDNKLNPYTAEEMLRTEFKSMGILATDDNARNVGGGGGNPQVMSAANSLSGATSKAQALSIAEKMALDNGYVRGSVEFSNAVADTWAKNASFLATLK